MQNLLNLSALRLAAALTLCHLTTTLVAADKPSRGSTAQAEALKRYPELAKEDSVFHQAYLTKVEKYRRESPAVLEQPGWELAIAEEVAAGLTTKAKEALKISRLPDSGGKPADAQDNPRIQVRNLGSSREIDAQLRISYADGSEVIDKHHFAPAAEVTYPSDAAGKRLRQVEIVSASFTEKTAPPAPAPAKKPKPKGTLAIPVAGKPGFVVSPFSPDAGYIDVRGFPPGTEVQDPYSGEKILVP